MLLTVPFPAWVPPLHHEEIPIDEIFERLKALDGKHVWVSLVRAKDQNGVPVYRSGVFRLFAQPPGAPAPLTCILDADGLPLVTFLGPDTFSLVDGALRAEFRPTFRVDVLERPFPGANDGAEADMMYEHAARELVAELEAGFRTALIMRPDPDPEASLRARYNVPPIEDGPLSDWSVRFAVGHNSSTLRPHDDGIVRLTNSGTSVRDGQQVVDLFEPVGGPHYQLKTADIARLAGDIRSFLSGRRERFVPVSGGSR